MRLFPSFIYKKCFSFTFYFLVQFLNDQTKQRKKEPNNLTGKPLEFISYYMHNRHFGNSWNCVLPLTIIILLNKCRHEVSSNKVTRRMVNCVNVYFKKCFNLGFFGMPCENASMLGRNSLNM